MKKIILITLLLGATYLFAQQVDKVLLDETYITHEEDSTLINEANIIKNELLLQSQLIEELNAKMEKQVSSIFNQNRTIRLLEDKNEALKESIDSLNGIIQLNSRNIEVNSAQIGSEIERVTLTANTQFSQLISSIAKNRTYWIIAILAILFLSVLIYSLLSKQMRLNKTDVETQIKNTRAALEEESVKLDSKLIEVISKQIELIKSDQSNDTLKKDDHSLVLKVADRLTVMETNLHRMDPETKGLKQLLRAVKSIKENYLANGYEIMEMLGLEYKEGLNVTANFIPSEEIDTGKRIITRVIKPQVNFNGKRIQAAQIEVSVGE